LLFFFFQAEDGIRDFHVTGVQTCALPILPLEAVKNEIEPIVRNRVKAKKLIAQANEASNGATSLAQIGEKLGKSPVSAENIVFRSEERRVGKECRYRW